MSALRTRVAADGWGLARPVVAADVIDRLLDALAELAPSSAARGGVRNLLDVPEVRTLARSAAVREVAEDVLGPACVAVRGILFDKTPAANWKVAWHQDVTIAVRERRDVARFGPWSEKAGVPHVQAPADVLERMLAVRVHLDNCGAANGPVRVIPGSHRAGRLAPADVEAWRARVPPVSCLAPRGGMLALRPLVLHASAPAAKPAHRRVIHLEFAAGGLPGGLEWHDQA